MSALGDFIHAQMDARRWQQIDLAHHSGLSKQVVSRILAGGQGTGKRWRMLDPATVTALAGAFEVDEEVILLKLAEDIGIPVTKPITITVIREPSVEEIAERVRQALLLERNVRGGHQSDDVPAPNPRRAVRDDGDYGGKVSGGTGTSGDLRDPRRRSHGSDTTHDGELHAHPHLL